MVSTAAEENFTEVWEEKILKLGRVLSGGVRLYCAPIISRWQQKREKSFQISGSGFQITAFEG
jgi:hypothetical protein